MNSICGETMALTLMLWLCSVLVVFLIVGPLFGTWVASATGLALLGIYLAICWAICVKRTFEGR